ncbi:type I phosphomannose isomerase catalytic subunit [Butyrivibrio sp. AC2005]|uniref:type I phosphomannose isomerase catalytic subunit n=1 Tax=Butyrivibrio sp. AC2005 TaxID=1280672 RepID=UPI000426850D|nr:type I phosphomannose isomerase catalytic subunit [Butyrivibrio sp. AC2005]
MSILKLCAPTKDYLWGGNRLVKEFGKLSAGAATAESWELSCFPRSESVIDNGEFAGKTLSAYINHFGKSILGNNCKNFEKFPVLVKLIDAMQDLSIQVHPSDEYALKNENQYGKTEMWYIIDAEKDAFLYYGFNREIAKEEFKRRIIDQTLPEVLCKKYVKKGDVIFIESGTIHAIGKGILLAEIQQNSNITYRVYDYGRKDKDGRFRELHIDNALDVTCLGPVEEFPNHSNHLAKCKYFTVDKISNNCDISNSFKGNVGNDTFLHILILDGEGLIKNNNNTINYKKGDSFFIPAGSGEYEIKGTYEALMTYV